MTKSAGRPKACGNYGRYQAKQPPKCCGGSGCDRCWAIYEARQKADAEAAQAKGGPDEKLNVASDAKGDLIVHYEGTVVRSIDELVADANIDTRLWEIAHSEVKHWPVAGKLSRGQDEKGRWLGEELWQQSLRSIRVVLRRRAPKRYQDAIELLLGDWKPRELPSPKRKAAARVPHMAELAMHDAHFGKRAWEAQTGADFDVEIITADFCGAVDDLLGKLEPYSVDRILVVVGSDFFQVDNWLGTTAKGTVVDSTDDRFTKVFEAGFKSMEYKIRRAREIADVEVLWVPGNHDPSTSWYLARTLMEAFKSDPHVSFDLGPKERKYVGYGPLALGLTHGDGIPLSRLPLIMATEAPELWAAAWHREIHTGHLHKKRKLDFMSCDEDGGVTVRILPSLSGTDHWHYKSGFVGALRAAEVYLWSFEDGYAGHLEAPARSFKAAQERRILAMKGQGGGLVRGRRSDRRKKVSRAA